MTITWSVLSRAWYRRPVTSCDASSEHLLLLEWLNSGGSFGNSIYISGSFIHVKREMTKREFSKWFSSFSAGLKRLYSGQFLFWIIYILKCYFLKDVNFTCKPERLMLGSKLSVSIIVQVFFSKILWYSWYFDSEMRIYASFTFNVDFC